MRKFVSEIREIKRILNLRLEAETAEMKADLALAAEIAMGEFLFEKELANKSARLKNFSRHAVFSKKKLPSRILPRWWLFGFGVKMLEEEAKTRSYRR